MRIAERLFDVVVVAGWVCCAVVLLGLRHYAGFAVLCMLAVAAFGAWWLASRAWEQWPDPNHEPDPPMTAHDGWDGHEREWAQFVGGVRADATDRAQLVPPTLGTVCLSCLRRPARPGSAECEPCFTVAVGDITTTIPAVTAPAGDDLELAQEVQFERHRDAMEPAHDSD